jgi:hypothetical protein
MRDLGEYLRAYVAYVSANLGWGKALRFVLAWLAGMFVPLAALLAPLETRIDGYDQRRRHHPVGIQKVGSTTSK